MSETYGYNGFQDLANILENYIEKSENTIEILREGAKEFTNDLLKLSKPMSEIKKTGYTHLVKTFSYREKNKEIEVGWGKYYGPMLEYGTKKMKSRAHIYPLWNKNKEKYYKAMLTKLGMKTW